MTPKTSAAQLTALADLLNDNAVYDVVAGFVADIRNEHPRPCNEDGEPLDVDSGVLLDRLIAELRRTATEQPA